MPRKQTTSLKAAKKVQSEPRSRTFTGCGTCRSRHLKCDEAKPTCSTCRRLNLRCQGYAPRLLWVSASAEGKLSAKSEESNSFRYPLFSEEHRTSMSLNMVQSLGDQSAGDVLDNLDTESVPNDDLYGVGPFGVFRVFQDTASEDPACSSPCQRSDDDVEEIPLREPQVRGFTPLLADSFSAVTSEQVYPRLSTEIEASDYDVTFGMDLGLSWQDGSLPFFSNEFDMGFSFSPIGTPKYGTSKRAMTPRTRQSLSPRPQQEAPCPEPLSPLPGASEYNQIYDALSRVPSPRNNPMTQSSSALPSHAAILLQHLKTEVLEGTTSSLHRAMSPWRLLLLPCALETVAEISLWNSTSCARRSILSTLLAKSAFHLSNSTDQGATASSYWLKIGTEQQQDAQKHLQSALRTELENRAKYVEMLMAILSVGVVSVYYYGPQAIRKLLLDAEHLIRLHGLPATKTFRHRVLHHMYTHLRLILETTNVTLKSVEATETQPESASSQLIEYKIPRSFGIKAQNLGDLDVTRQKSEDIGYNDIHLDVTGMWQATMYPEIYGVPETLMSLLSQTISLVNEKPRLEAAGIQDPLVAIALSKHIRTLEQQIWSWKCDSRPTPSSGGSDAAAQPRPHMESMILAMHQSLIIYFYRRVYNMSVMIIQSQVQKALEFIQPCLDLGRFDSDFSVSIGWSTFIAACEAATPDLQELGLTCLEAVDGHGMFLEYGKPSDLAKAVWERREQTKDFTFGWPDLVSQKMTLAN